MSIAYVYCDESIETAFVVNRGSSTATADLVETSETLTLDELHPTSIAEIVEVIKRSTETEVLTSDADISVTETLVVVVASESEEVDEESEAAIEGPEVDGYAVYGPASDPVPVSDPLSLAA